MSTNPLRENLNRANQIKSDKGDLKQSINLFDIDYAMMSYLENTALPTLDENGKGLKIPVIYGNSERWKGARRDGVYRDAKGKLQLPVMMIRRTSISKDETMPFIKRGVSYQTISKYSKDNRYDKFSIFNGQQKPKKELYKILMPEFIDVNYECMVWTGYIEQLNEVIEALNFTGQYWGDKDKFKFRTTVADYNIVNEVGDGTERINRVEFTLAVKAYLLPETFDGESPIKKSFSTKRIVVATETDVTGNGRLEGLLTTPSPYYDNKDLIDFLSLNNSKVVDGGINTATFSGIKLIEAPAQLTGVITSGLTYDGKSYDIKLYINGVRYYQTSSHFAVTSYTDNTLILTLSPGFPVDSGDEITITGKFIEIV
jgi:hypothetical protein